MMYFHQRLILYYLYLFLYSDIILVHFPEYPFFDPNSNIVVFPVCDILSHQN